MCKRERKRERGRGELLAMSSRVKSQKILFNKKCYHLAALQGLKMEINFFVKTIAD